MFIFALLMIAVLLFLNKNLLKLPIGITRPNIFSMVVYRDFGVLTAIALSYWLWDRQAHTEHYILGQIPDQYLELALYASFIFMIFFIFYSGFWAIVFKSFNNRLKVGSVENYLMYLKIFFIFLLLMLVVMYYKNPPVLMNLLAGATAYDVSVLRSEVGGNAFFKIIRSSWMPIVAYTFYYFYLDAKYRAKVKIYTYFSGLMAVICALWSGAKSPIATLLLGYLGVYLAYNFNNKLKLSTIIVFVGVFLGLILAMYALTTLNTDSTIFDNFQVAQKRLFTQAGGVAYSFYMYPNFLDFKYFNGISSFLSGLNGSQFSSVYGDLIDNAVPEDSDISGALSSFAAGDAYGLFDWYGIILGPIFASFFYCLFYYLGAQGNIKHVFVGIYAVYFGNAYLASSFYSFVWPVGIFISLFPFIFFYILSLKRI
ncbi:hypothetical protein R4641_15095 [Acinetobacter baumannii]|uniref:hypothetical protein n=1 Tax=Acinetobacter baumannii TaxID=470 RepID=UPI000B239C2F|nr:hypothetical protein [Acinetobacter baumannii]MDC4480474.1 hypothetical protein [Acinetobacter baumannii]MDC4771122.1 hypothetical protein [Acinetobacter baumannii]MDC5305719.1 hypothetical protein [Acinetobacter baumannii]MDC5398286.1 hypothetical protein [Acinetobacter baumannii]MDH2625651.1 hypothetical protein [Acinetobacter baumannii]